MLLNGTCRRCPQGFAQVFYKYYCRQILTRCGGKKLAGANYGISNVRINGGNNNERSPCTFMPLSVISHTASRKQVCTYTQGEEIGNKRRCYFYFVDHNGYLFLDDVRMRNFTSCYKDPEFLEFFYTRIRQTRTTDPGFDHYGAGSRRESLS